MSEAEGGGRRPFPAGARDAVSRSAPRVRLGAPPGHHANAPPHPRARQPVPPARPAGPRPCARPATRTPWALVLHVARRPRREDGDTAPPSDPAGARVAPEVSPRETLEGLVDLVEPGEGAQPPRSLVQLPGGLRPAQQEDAEHRDLVVGEAQRLVEELPVLRGAAPCTARQARPAAPRETLERLVDLRLGVLDDRVAVGRLVAREAQGVEREWVLVGRRPLLLEEAAEHPKLDGIGVHERSVRCGMSVDLPIRDCYRVADGFLAGEYPGSADLDEATRRLRAFARHGVDLVPRPDASRRPARAVRPTPRRRCEARRSPDRRPRDDDDPAHGQDPRRRGQRDRPGPHGVRPLLGRDRADRHRRGLLADAPRARRRGPDREDRGAPSRRVRRARAVSPDVRAACDGARVEAGSLSALVAAVLPHAWRRESAWHGELHWRCVAATGLELASADGGCRPRTGLLLRPSPRHTPHQRGRRSGARVARGGVRAGACRRRVCCSWTSPASPLSSRRCGSTRTDRSRPTRRSAPAGTPTACTSRAFRSCRIPRSSRHAPPTGVRALSAAETLRTHGPPMWDALVALACPPALREGSERRRASPDRARRCARRTSQSWHEVGTDT